MERGYSKPHLKEKIALAKIMSRMYVPRINGISRLQLTWMRQQRVIT